MVEVQTGADSIDGGELEAFLRAGLENTLVALGAESWRVTFECYADREDPNDMTVATQSEYRHALMSFNLAHLQHDEGERLLEGIRHEVLHLMLSDLVEVAEDLVGERPFARAQLEKAHELAVTRLSRCAAMRSGVPAPMPTAAKPEGSASTSSATDATPQEPGSRRESPPVVRAATERAAGG